MTSDASVAAPTTMIIGGTARRCFDWRRFLLVALLALLCGPVWTIPAWPQVPDNRGVKLDPEDQVSPAYRDTLDERDRQRLERAQARGDSFMTTFQGAGRVPGETAADVPPAIGTSEEDRSGRAVSAQESDRPAERPRPVYEHVDRLHGDGVDTGDGLAAMMDVLLESWNRAPEIARLRYAPLEERAGTASDENPARTSAVARPLPRIRAGDGIYARTVYAVDSDYPGPVVLELLQPPLTGAVATGGFERAGVRLVLRLTSLSWRGETVPVDAWAVDPGCACYGIEGEVDRHFLSRVVLPAAARFAEGFLTAAAMPARTLTVQDGTVLHERDESGTEEALYAGAGAAVRTLGDILMADAPRETTVRIPRDTPLVVMFATPPTHRRGERTDERD